MTRPHETSDGRFQFRSDLYAWYVVAVLCVGSVVAMIDRQVINLLVEPIKADLGISDTQVSLLQGFAFALFYAAMAIPLGRLADTGSRRGTIIAGAIVFSTATFTCGFAAGFGILFAARMMVGVGEATLTPAGYSLLSDYFPKAQLGRAISLFTGTGFVGSGLALLFIGWMISLIDASGGVSLPIIGNASNWQLAFMASALPGLAFALLMITIKEPPRSSHPPVSGRDAEPALDSSVMAFFRSNFSVLSPIYIGLPVLAAANFGLNAWTPTFFIRAHGWSAGEIGPTFGAMVMVLCTSGVIVGGWAADRMTLRGRQESYLIVPMFAGFIAFPFAVAFPLVESAEVSLLLLAPLLFFAAMPFGAGTAAIPSLAPNRMRAQMTAIYLLFANLIGGGIGPWAVAFYTDQVAGGPLLIGRSLSVVCSALLLLGAVALAFGVHNIRKGRRASTPQPGPQPA